MIGLSSSQLQDITDPPSSDSSNLTSPERSKVVLSQMDIAGIPKFLQESYQHGKDLPIVTTLRTWQNELFQMQEWKDRNNCLILVPTAGGKTVAAEVAIARVLEQDENAKIIYCLPYVSLAHEKFTEFKQRFNNFSVKPFYANIGGSDFARGHIAICTFEKAHTIINSAIKQNYIDKFKLIVIDEIHMLGDQHRGATIEALVSKLQLVDNFPQIIGLSATINKNDSEIYRQWINGFVYTCCDRPSIIQQYNVSPTGQLSRIRQGEIGKPLKKFETIPQDKNYFLPIIADTLSRNPSNTILIFVNSRKDTRIYAEFIAKNLYTKFASIAKIPPASLEILIARRQLVQDINLLSSKERDPTLSECLMKGVAFHNAGLLLEERKFIEDSLRKGIINVVVATTTLSAGINITNVASVIINNVFREIGLEKTPLTGAQYSQMAGRAGRTGLIDGKVFIIQHTQNEREVNLIEELGKYNINCIVGHMLEPDEFDRYFLQCLAFFRNEKAFRFPFYAYETKRQNISDEKIDLMIEESIARLIDKGLILPNYEVTRLGEAIAGANFGIDEGLKVYEEMTNAQKNICLSDEIHILYLTIPSDIGFRTPSYQKEEIWISLFNKHKHVINEILKLSGCQLEQKISLSYIRGGLKNDDEVDKMLDKIYAASILLELVNETPISQIEAEFGVDRGLVQSLQKNVSTFAGQVAKFCEICSFPLLKAVIDTFRKRLDFSVKNELLPLMSLSSCSKMFARIFFNRGIKTPDDLIQWTTDDLVRIIPSGRHSISYIPFSQFHNSDDIAESLTIDESNDYHLRDVIRKIRNEAAHFVKLRQDLENISESFSNIKYDNL